MFPNDTDFDAKFTLENENISPSAEDLPFNILFFGDWSGRKANLVDATGVDFLPIEIDRDNFEQVLRKFRVSLDLNFSDDGENTISLEFSDLDDFHPDKIFQKLSLFANLRNIREKLSNTNTYNEAAREVRSWLAGDGADISNPCEQNETAADSMGSQDNLLDRILGQTVADSFSTPTVNDESKELKKFIKEIVTPHLIEIDTGEQSNLLLVVDEVISDLMRKIIHHPEFQALESSWRGVYLLVRKIETSQSLKIFLLDLDKLHFLNDLKSNDDLTQSKTFKLMNDSENQWAIAYCNYTFGLDVSNAAALIRIMKIGFSTDTPFISHAQPVLFGLESFDSDLSTDKLRISDDSKELNIWKTLRALPEAEYLGLALPKFLGRLPYGEKTEPIESFYFEEVTPTVYQEQFLWVNPSFLCALLLAQSFSESGWNFPTNLIQNVDDLPVYYYREATETKAKPCTEFVLTQSNAEILIEQGFIPLISFRDTDRVRIGRFQSIAAAGKMLKGKWDN